MRRISLLLLLAGFLGSHAEADTLVAEPVKDNTLYEDAQGQLSNGAGTYLFMGRTGGDKGVDRLLRRTLLSFDLSSIPPGSEIASAELSLTIDTVPLQAIAGVASVHRLHSDWGEGTSNAPGPEGQGTRASPGDATWLHTFSDTALWTSAGGDFDTNASQTTPFGDVPQTLVFASSPGLLADVSLWVDQPDSNFGWIVRGDEPVVQNARRFISREYSNAQLRPRLTVEYTPFTPVEITRPVPATEPLGLILLISLMLFISWSIERRR